MYYSQIQDPLLKWIDAQAVKDSEVYKFFAKESLVSDIDSAQRFLYQNLWYGGSLEKVGYLRGMEEVPIAEPLQSFDGTPYFTHGIPVRRVPCT